MGVWMEAWNRVRTFFHKRQCDADLEAELAAHLEMAVDDNMAQGMSGEEARRQALVRFGGVQRAKEQQRRARGLPWIDVLLQDLRYTLSTLRRDRAFTAVVVLILGLGIGANIAVFSVVNTILLRPLPFQDPNELVRILSKKTAGGESSMTYSSDAIAEFRQRTRAFQEVTGYFAFSGSDNFRLTGQGQPRPVTDLMVAQNFFHTLGVVPSAGRLFTPEECVHNSRPVVLLSHAFWKRQYGGNHNILGQAIQLNGSPVIVVGVLPETFDFGSVFSPGAKIDMFTPAILEDMQDWGNTMALVGRLRPRVSLAQAQAEADTLFPSLHFNLKHPDWGGDYTGRLLSLKDYVSGKLRQSLLVLWFAVGTGLLIVCVNLSNLLLARTAAHSKEFAMRSALGAGRWRLITQRRREIGIRIALGATRGRVQFDVIAKTLRLALIGIAVGVLGSIVGARVIATLLFDTAPTDPATFAAMTTLLFAVALVAGYVPARRASGIDPMIALRNN